MLAYISKNLNDTASFTPLDTTTLNLKYEIERILVLVNVSSTGKVRMACVSMSIIWARLVILIRTTFIFTKYKLLTNYFHIYITSQLKSKLYTNII
jgi:hypothetical protein